MKGGADKRAHMSAATRLKQLVDERGIRYTFIAEKTGIPLGAISKCFYGRRRMLADELLAICDATGIDPNDLREAQTRPAQ